MAAKHSASTRAACVFAAETDRGADFAAPRDDLLDERQKADVQRVVTAAHALVLAVCCEEELLEVVAANRNEIGHFEELSRGEGQRWGFPASRRS